MAGECGGVDVVAMECPLPRESGTPEGVVECCWEPEEGWRDLAQALIAGALRRSAVPVKRLICDTTAIRKTCKI